MRVHLYTIVWNEEAMLPFFFRHYDPLVDRYVVYDDGSSDRTAEILSAHDRVEIRPFLRSDPDSFLLSQIALFDTIWKESRGHADWVIVCDVDELLHHSAGLTPYLEASAANGVTAVPALAFQMICDRFPEPGEHLAETHRFGVPYDKYNKLGIFNPEAVMETNYTIGRHRASPQGDVRFPEQDELLLLHYKYLGIDYMLRRYPLLAGHLGKGDKARDFGNHLERPAPVLEAEFNRVLLAAQDATGAGFDGLERKKWWRLKAPKLPKPPKPPKTIKVAKRSKYLSLVDETGQSRMVKRGKMPKRPRPAGTARPSPADISTEQARSREQSKAHRIAGALRARIMPKRA